MPDKSDELLHKAIARNVSTVLSLPSAGVTRHHKSRFICNVEEGILLEAPDHDRGLIAEMLRNEKPIGVSFRSGIYKVTFAAPIRRTEPNWKLNGHTTVHALVLDFPTRVQVTQKRSDYRVEIQSDTEIAVRIWRLAINDDLNDQPAETKEVTAQILDLSTGGIGVRLIGPDGKKPKICTQDRLRIALTFEGAEMILEGRMRPPAARSQGNWIASGIQFRKSQSNPDAKTDSRLLKVFVELQRRELRRNKLGMKKSA